tara:strand:+ start:163719 stop:164495 length:777 start_codon:yes stop_codon:yes gene_type:complete
MNIFSNSFKILLFTLLFIACKSDDNGNTTEDLTEANKQSLGASAEDLLSSGDFESLTIEFVYAEGFRPNTQSINDFIAFLEERVNKPTGVSVVETVIEPPANAPFTIQEIVQIEEQNRTQYNSGQNIAVYIFFANGSSSNDTPTKVTLGSAYRNTSIVIYEKTLQNLNQQGLNLIALETSTLNHEFGHLFGLVNIVEDDIHTEHEDLENAKHCNVEECLMYFESAASRTAVMNRFFGKNSVAELDILCIEDLQAKGGL